MRIICVTSELDSWKQYMPLEPRILTSKSKKWSPDLELEHASRMSIQPVVVKGLWPSWKKILSYFISVTTAWENAGDAELLLWEFWVWSFSWCLLQSGEPHASWFYYLRHQSLAELCWWSGDPSDQEPLRSQSHSMTSPLPPCEHYSEMEGKWEQWLPWSVSTKVCLGLTVKGQH